MERFGWSLRDIDETDIESLLPFVFRVTGKNREKPAGPGRVYADQVSWL